MGLLDYINFKKKEQDKEFFFWKTMDLCDWQYEGDDDKVLKPVVSFLSTQSDELIFQFEDIMTELLYHLDTKSNFEKCKAISGDDSGDMFLYSRCVALINGRDYYENVVNGNVEELWKMEFESLLYVPEEAWALKHDEDTNNYPHISPLSYETGSNKEEWI